MKMELTLISRALHDPQRTFQEFVLRPHYEALIPIVVVSLVSSARAYFGMVGEGGTGAVPGIIGLVFVFVYTALGMVAPPLLNAVLVQGLRLRKLNTDITFASLFTAFALGSLPLYLGLLLTSVSGRFYFGLGDLFRGVGASQSVVFLLLAAVTPYLLWAAYLWWTAVTVLLQVTARQRLFLVLAFVFLYAVVVQFLSQALFQFIHLS